MIADLFRAMLQTALFSSTTESTLAIIADTNTADRDFSVPIGGTNNSTRYFTLPKSVIPENVSFIQLSYTEQFIEDLRTNIPEGTLSNIFILPPFITFTPTSRTFKPKRSRITFEQMILSTTVSTLLPKSKIAMTVPQSVLNSEASRGLREFLFESASEIVIISHPNFWLAGVSSQFKIATLILELGTTDRPLLRFFKVPDKFDAIEESRILSDFRRFMRQGGGKTEYGFILRDSLSAGTPLLYDMHSPAAQSRKADIANLGSTKFLGDVADVFIGANTLNIMHRLLLAEEGHGVPLIGGREIRRDGSLDPETAKYRLPNPADGETLRAGDICIRAIVGNDQQLVLTCIKPADLPLVASNTIIIVRPKPTLNQEDIEVLLAYLNSQISMQFLRSHGLGISIPISLITQLPIPFADESLRIAIRSLSDAIIQFDRWKADAIQMRGSLFGFSTMKEARMQLLASGRQARQRIEAGRLIADFDYRVRTQFPHPIAYRYRTVETEYRDKERYDQLLETAEVIVCYLASVAILLARYLSLDIAYVGEMARQLASGKGGTSMGDWVAVIREINESRKFRDLPDSTPFYEILHFLAQPDVDAAITRLKDKRDDQSHGRGPKDGEVPLAFTEARPHLTVLLQSIEFLAEYPLRYIEDTRRDSLRKITEYDYRDLMGDHPLAPINHSTAESAEMEKGSLYLVDRSDGLHLVRPLLTRRRCGKCGSWATFYLDRYEPRTGITHLKSMEHGHHDYTINSADITAEFKAVSLIP